jgi:hypothetical protein
VKRHTVSCWVRAPRRSTQRWAHKNMIVRILKFLFLTVIATCTTAAAGSSPFEACGVTSNQPRTEKLVRCVLTETSSFIRETQQLYQRASRNMPPRLRNGRIVFSLSISPQGRAAVKVTSNELEDEKLAEDIAQVLEGVDFGVTNGEAIVVKYHLDFSQP